MWICLVVDGWREWPSRHGSYQIHSVIGPFQSKDDAFIFERRHDELLEHSDLSLVPIEVNSPNGLVRDLQTDVSI